MPLSLTARLLALTFFLTACGGGGGGGGGGPTPVPGSPAPEVVPGGYTPPESEPVDRSAVEELDRQLAGLDFADLVDLVTEVISLRDPQAVISAGLTDIFNLAELALTDIRFDYRSVSYDMWQIAKNHLLQIDRDALSPQEQLSYDIFNWQIDSALAEREFMHYEYQASYFILSTPRSTQRFFSDLLPLESRQDVRNYLNLLAAVETKFAQLADNLLRSEQEGVIESAITGEYAITLLEDVVNTDLSFSPYYQRFSEDIAGISGLSDEERIDFKNRAGAIIAEQINPGYENLIAVMSDLLTRAPAQIGVGSLPRGEAYYRERLQHHTTTTLTPQQIHELGLAEVARIQAEMRVLFDQLGYPRDESLKELISRTATDGGTVAPADALGVYEALIDDAEIRSLALFNRLPETEVQVIGGEVNGLYISASLDGTRPGAFYAGTNREQSRYLMPSLAYHEAIPGHHMQQAIAQESEIPLFRRINGYNAFSEGWGLYAERLASDYNWYEDDPHGDLGRLTYEALRAVRLVVDTGIHHYGWDFERATNYVVDNLGISRGSAEGSIFRYSVYPGQATSYMIGMLKLLELRERMSTALGDDFSIMQFHALVLENGEMPLALLEQLVDQAIADQTGQTLQ
jgi:uncharacterized protein (DUF885 family)